MIVYIAYIELLAVLIPLPHTTVRAAPFGINADYREFIFLRAYLSRALTNVLKSS